MPALNEMYYVCDHIIFSIYSTTMRLYGAPLIHAYVSGAGPPKVIGARDGHGGEQHCDGLTNCMLQTPLPNSNTSDKIIQRLYRDYAETTCSINVLT